MGVGDSRCADEEKDAEGGRARTSANAASAIAASACHPRRALGAFFDRNRGTDSSDVSIACAAKTAR